MELGSMGCLGGRDGKLTGSEQQIENQKIQTGQVVEGRVEDTKKTKTIYKI